MYYVSKRNCLEIQCNPLIIITLGPALFDNNNWLITLSRGYKNLHYLTQFIVTTFYMYKKNNKIYLKNLCSVACCLFHSLDGNDVCQTSTLFNDWPVLSAESN